nr:MAG TPA: hypothetical protein [Caudoviricetes sp.]
MNSKLFTQSTPVIFLTPIVKAALPTSGRQ